MANPLAKFSSPLTTNALRVPAMPKLSVANGKVLTSDDVAKFNTEMEVWRQNFERQLVERVPGQAAVSKP
jgi:hypothetical protein